MSYQTRIVATPSVYPQDGGKNGVWTFADIEGTGNQDLVFIKTRQTRVGKVELRAASQESDYKDAILIVTTAFRIEDNGTWLMQDWTRDGRADLVYIKTRHTESGRVEVHVVDAASGYQSFVLHKATCFNPEDNGTWTMSATGDLVYIKTRNTGSGFVEYHVASRDSDYQEFTKHKATWFTAEENGTWCLNPTMDGEFADLFYIKTKNTQTHKIEVHGASAQSDFQEPLINTETDFDLEENGTWHMINYARAPNEEPPSLPDLAYIKTKNTGTGEVEVHINEA
ncbi:hypothetical protein CEP51_013407 [Fusarium floridanum]|uniref:Uncharacterized protein n=1 Tax=Fusarium floridanum TaxID=1325733 RepID=A0A428QBX4_9HYPO|nr:hypothetical protein CEP51_013407 [Fusarium floridanum]